MKENKLVEWILTAVFLILSVFGIILLVWSLIGDSPTEIQTLSAFVGIIISYLIIASFKVGVFMGEMREFKEITKNSFVRIRDDMDTLRKDVKEEFDEIKRELKFIAEKVK